jgi:hypothetical protein
MLCVEIQPQTDVLVNSKEEKGPLGDLDLSKTGTKFDTRRNLDNQLLDQNTFVDRKSPQAIVDKGRMFANCADSAPSELGRGRDDDEVRARDEDSREVRQLLKWTRSMFPNQTGFRRCPFSVAGDCNGRHCEPFWKPILKQEQRRTPLCGEDCKYCHDPRHFPDDEWVKLHVHRTPAARRRASKKQKKTNAIEAGYNAPPCDAVSTMKADGVFIADDEHGGTQHALAEEAAAGLLGESWTILDTAGRPGQSWADVPIEEQEDEN